MYQCYIMLLFAFCELQALNTKENCHYSIIVKRPIFSICNHYTCCDCKKSIFCRNLDLRISVLLPCKSQIQRKNGFCNLWEWESWIDKEKNGYFTTCAKKLVLPSVTRDLYYVLWNYKKLIVLIIHAFIISGMAFLKLPWLCHPALILHFGQRQCTDLHN